MPIDASSDDLDSLRELVAQLSSERDAALAECKRVMEQNDRLRHLLQQLRRAQFGSKSERLDREQLQLAMEDLETAVAAEDAEQDKTAPIEDAPKKKRKTNRGSLPAHLPRVHITLAPDSTACPCCHGVMHVIGEETPERLDKIPAQDQVVYLRMKEIVLASAKVVVGETRAPGLDPARGRTKTGYFLPT